jgi:beta-mannosidase
MSTTAVNTLSLNGEWQLARCPLKKTADYAKRPRQGAIDAIVPGDVHLDLMKTGEISDPLIRDQAKHCAWIGEREWWYSKTFRATLPKGARHELVFDGLCYVADVWLNGTHVARHLTMHRPLRVNVTKTLKADAENLLVVRLLAFDAEALETPVISRDAEWSDGIADKRHCLKRAATHKALYSFGWDWTQGLSICGIWRDVRLESTPVARIENVFVRASRDGAVNVSFETDSNLRGIRAAKASLVLREKISKAACANVEMELILGPGHEVYAFAATLEKPKLWQPAGLGDAFLYEAEIVLSLSDGVADKSLTVFGVRSVESVESQVSETQGTFKFIVNGEPVFLKGANWIPPDIIPARATPEVYQTLIRQTVECGMNYLRFWGGGIYESSLFYELCDELGIMVWQEMMFSCPEFPDFDPAYVEESRKEVAWAVKAYRNHPSVIVWCGSNETDTLHLETGKLARPNGKYYGYRILHDVLPGVIGPLDPTRAYLPSCPALGKFSPPGNPPRDFSFGTSHGNFAHAFATDAALDNGKIPAFLNECYANSPDPACSIKKYLAEADLNAWDNPVFDAHSVMNVQYSGERGLFSEQLYFHHSSRFPDLPMEETFAAFHDNHCELVKRYTEFLRRHQDLCGGVAFWMLNSAYTMMDWSFVDYYLVPKPVFYAAKRANVVILPIVAVYEERLDFHVASDSLKETGAELACEVRTFNGETIARQTKRITIKPNVSELHLSLGRKELGAFAPEDSFAQAVVKLDSGETIRNYRFLTKLRELRLPAANVTITAVAGEPGVFALSSNVFVRRLELLPNDEHNRPDDNHFDLLPGVEKRVVFLKPLPLKSVTLTWLNDASRDCVVTGLEKDDIAGTWNVTVFNATAGKIAVSPELKGAPGCVFNAPDRVALDAHASATIPISAGVDILTMEPGTLAFPIDLKIGSARVLDSLLAPRPFSFKSGVLEVANPSRQAIKGGTLSFHCETSDGKSLVLDTPPVEIPAKGVFVHDFKLPPNCLPHTYALWRGKKKLCSFWGEPARGGDQWNSLPVRPFDGKPIKAFKTKGNTPNLQTEGNGYFVEPGMSGENLAWIDERNGRFAFFLHYTAKSLFFDLFVWDMPFAQRFFGEQVYQDSAAELVLGDQDNATYHDYSMALTHVGPELFIRRGHDGFRHGLVKDASLEIFDQPENAATYYRCRFDLAKIGMPNLFKPGAFKMALVVRGQDQKRIVLFNGVTCGAGVENAGVVTLA